MKISKKELALAASGMAVASVTDPKSYEAALTSFWKEFQEADV